MNFGRKSRNVRIYNSSSAVIQPPHDRYYRSADGFQGAQVNGTGSYYSHNSGFETSSSRTNSASYVDDISYYESDSMSINEELLAEKLRKVALEREMEELAQNTRFNATDFKVNGYVPPMERFYVNEGCGNPEREVEEKEEKIVFRNTFAGRKDFLNPHSLDEHEIKSRNGTVRGFKNRVRAGIATFVAPADDKANKKNQYLVEEKGKIVFYSTRLQVIRSTYDKCKTVRNILQTHMVQYNEKDLLLNRDLQRELMERLDSDVVAVPQVFVDGKLLGGVEQIQRLNETGELRKIFRHFPKIRRRSSCSKCGGYRYVPCSVCHGSTKSFHRIYHLQEFRALRCTTCNTNGLLRCDACLDQPD